MIEIPGTLAWDEESYGYPELPIRLYEIPEWRRTGEEKWMEFYLPEKDSWEPVKAHWAPVLEGLVEGEALPWCEVRLRDARPDMNAATRAHVVRKVLRNLEHLGMAELVTPDPPERFDGRYEVLEQLGQGGIGVVWLCKDLETEGHPKVAVKHAWNWKTGFDRAEDSLKKEAEMLDRFDHPSIIRLIDTFQVEGRFHMVREFLEGRSLSSCCGTSELDGDRRVRMVEQMADQLAYIRDEGWLYLDVSPSNYYVDEELRTLKLGDLGVCKRAEDGTYEVSGRTGTTRYAAPEMMEGGTATERSLVYSLGRVLWKMVMGRIPVPRTSLEKVHRQDRAILELLRESRATEREVEFYDHATRTDPDERPATLEDAVAILDG